jgi:hypothetical protein
MPRRQSPDAPPPEPPATLIAAGPSIPRRVRSLLPASRREAVAAASFPAGSRAPDPIPPERPCSPTAGALLLAGLRPLEDPAQPRHARTASGRRELRPANSPATPPTASRRGERQPAPRREAPFFTDSQRAGFSTYTARQREALPTGLSREHVSVCVRG